MKALVRGVASTFASAITSQQLSSNPIQQALAVQQHDAYVQLLRLLVSKVIVLPADDKYPDCTFIEDAAVVVGDTAIIASIGAASRQGEEAAVAAALQQLGCQLAHLAPPATLDGGDVLQLPDSRHILVGLSRRTNAAAVQQLASLLPRHLLLGVPVEHGLHLKSAMTALDGRTLLFADNAAGHALSRQLLRLLPPPPPALDNSGGGWQHVVVPDPICANVLLLGEGGRDVVMPAGGFPASEALLEDLCRERRLALHKLPAMTEFMKADGSLTCCSILLP